MAGEGPGTDWRNAAAYRPLLEADRSVFAWEWLKRDPDYRAAASRALSAHRARGAGSHCEGSEGWGLHDFVAADLAAPRARPLWRTEVHPYVIVAEAGPPAGIDDFDIGRLAVMSNLVTGEDREHWLFSDGLRAIRLDLIKGTLVDGPVQLRYRLAGLVEAERQALVLRRFLALWRTGGFCRALHPREARAKRWLLMLRAHDALSAGANQRAIAAELLAETAARPNWRLESPSLRSQVQRLVSGAKRMAAGGYWNLLR